MVHKLRNRDVCHTSPRPNQIQRNFIKTHTGPVHSTPDYNKIPRRRNVLSHVNLSSYYYH